MQASRVVQRNSTADAIVAASREIAETVDIKAICCFTQSGQDRRTGGARTSERADPRADTAGGRGPAHVPDLGDRVFHDRGAEPLQGRGGLGRAQRPRSSGYASEEDQIIVVAGVPFNVQGSTNILRVAPCAERLIYATDPE